MDRPAPAHCPTIGEFARFGLGHCPPFTSEQCACLHRMAEDAVVSPELEPAVTAATRQCRQLPDVRQPALRTRSAARRNSSPETCPSAPRPTKTPTTATRPPGRQLDNEFVPRDLPFGATANEDTDHRH